MSIDDRDSTVASGDGLGPTVAANADIGEALPLPDPGYRFGDMIGRGGSMAISANRWLDRRRWLLVVWIAVATGVPIALEATGVLTRTWILTRDNLQSISAVFQVEGSFEGYMLLVGNLLLVAAIALFAAGVHRDARNARRRLTSQAWHLGKLLPPEYAPLG